MTNRGKIGESLYLAFPRDLLAILSLLDRNLSVQLRTILICLVVFQLPQPSHARTNHLFENFSTERGLAGRLVRDIVQDEHGFICSLQRVGFHVMMAINSKTTITMLVIPIVWPVVTYGGYM